MCNSGGLVSCFHHTKVSFRCLHPSIYSHISDRFSPHTSGQWNIYFISLCFLPVSSLPLKKSQTLWWKAQAGRFSEVTYCCCLYDSGFSMARDLSVRCCAKHKREGCPVPAERCQRAVGRWLESMWKPQVHSTSISRNKQPCFWQSFCKPEGKQACLTLGCLVKALNWRTQSHFFNLSSPVKCPVRVLLGYIC